MMNSPTLTRQTALTHEQSEALKATWSGLKRQKSAESDDDDGGAASGGSPLGRQMSRPGGASSGGATEADDDFKIKYDEALDLMVIKCSDGYTILIAGFSKAFTFGLAHFHWFILEPGQRLVTSGDGVHPEKNWTTQHQHYSFPGRDDWDETVHWNGARTEPFKFEPKAFAKYAQLEATGRLTKWETLENGFHSMNEGDIAYVAGSFWTCTGSGQVKQSGLEYAGGNIGTPNTKAVEVDCEHFGLRKIRISNLAVLYIDQEDGTTIYAQVRSVGRHSYCLVNTSDQSSGSSKYGHLQSQVMVMSNKEYWTHGGITFQCEELSSGVFAIPHFAMVDEKYHPAISPETIATFIVNIDN
jgi:hypothetical protein